MTNVPTHAASAEVTPTDTHARGPLLLLIGSGLLWLVISGVLALITAIQLRTPGFMADCAWLTHGRAQALRESTFIYGWLANAGLAVALWVLGRLGGSPLRGLNWAVIGTLSWNTALAVGLVGIAIGDMTGYAFLQLPRYVLPAMAIAYAAIAVPGVLAWIGRRHDTTFAAQWYAVAALFILPWILAAAQLVLLWLPVRGVVQAIAATWYAQAAWTLWLAPLALAGAYYVVPKTAGKLMPSYDFASLSFWTLIFLGSWTGGRHLIGGPVPAWVATLAVMASSMVIFHYLVVFLNLRIATGSTGEAAKYIRFGLLAYVLYGVLELYTSFRSPALGVQFTFLAVALEQLALYGAVSMLFFGAIHFLVPRITSRPWASAGLASGHRVLVSIGIVVLLVALAAAGSTQAGLLADAKVSFGEITQRIGLPLLGVISAYLLLLAANLLLLVNFLQTALAFSGPSVQPQTLFRQPAVLEGSAT
jgi:cytochrome c oxidase cbb3-type subunit 1